MKSLFTTTSCQRHSLKWSSRPSTALRIHVRQRCLRGETQGQNEAFNGAMIWNMWPKQEFAAAEVVELPTHLPSACRKVTAPWFNPYGHTSFHTNLPLAGFNFCHNFFVVHNLYDNLNIPKALRYHLTVYKHLRTQHTWICVKPHIRLLAEMDAFPTMQTCLYTVKW